MALRQWCHHGGRALRRRRLPAQTRSLNRNGAETDGSAATTSAGTGGVRGGRFVFLGAPGVGKGTFAAIIAPQMVSEKQPRGSSTPTSRKALAASTAATSLGIPPIGSECMVLSLLVVAPRACGW